MFLTEQEAETVSQALDLIRDPSHWTHNSFARDSLGQSVAPNSLKATRWCASGALYECGDGCYTRGYDLDEKLDTLAAEMYDPITYLPLASIGELERRGKPLGNFVMVNDVLGHDAIVALFEKALAKL